jgi:hypothetical protein
VTTNPRIDELTRDGVLTPPDNPGGIAALLAITPAPASNTIDAAEVISELREERL